MWHLAQSMWEGTEATDIASQQESSTLTSIWNGVKNLFTPEEIAVELVELRGPLAAPVNEIPRLLSANMVTEFDEEEMDMLRVEWDEIPEVVRRVGGRSGSTRTGSRR
jgi:hypothetical protein